MDTLICECQLLIVKKYIYYATYTWLISLYLVFIS